MYFKPGQNTTLTFFSVAAGKLHSNTNFEGRILNYTSLVRCNKKLMFVIEKEEGQSWNKDD